MNVQRFHGFRAMFRRMDAPGIRSPDNHLRMVFSPAPIPDSCYMADYLVERRINETVKLYFRNRLQSIYCHPESCSHNSRFTQWGINYPVASEFFQQSLWCAENTPVLTDILAN